jgi:hypothetical protein
VNLHSVLGAGYAHHIYHYFTLLGLPCLVIRLFDSVMERYHFLLLGSASTVSVIPHWHLSLV